LLLFSPADLRPGSDTVNQFCYYIDGFVHVEPGSAFRADHSKDTATFAVIFVDCGDAILVKDGIYRAGFMTISAGNTVLTDGCHQTWQALHSVVKVRWPEVQVVAGYSNSPELGWALCARWAHSPKGVWVDTNHT